jgi:hypothetical protein
MYPNEKHQDIGEIRPLHNEYVEYIGQEFLEKVACIFKNTSALNCSIYVIAPASKNKLELKVIKWLVRSGFSQKKLYASILNPQSTGLTCSEYENIAFQQCDVIVVIKLNKILKDKQDKIDMSHKKIINMEDVSIFDDSHFELILKLHPHHREILEKLKSLQNRIFDYDDEHYNQFKTKYITKHPELEDIQQILNIQ